MLGGNGHVRGLDLARARTAQTDGGPSEPNNPLLIAVALFSIVLITAPALFGGNPKVKLLFLAPFLLCIAWALPRQTRTPVSGAGVTALSLYVLTVVIALIRQAHMGVESTFVGTFVTAVSFAVVAVFGVTLLTSTRNQVELWSRLVAVALSPAAYVATNAVLLQLVGEPATEYAVAQGTPAKLVEFLGLTATRVQFPLAGGLNSFGAVAAAGFAAAMLLLLRTSVDRRLSALAAAICLYGVFATDSRGVLLISLGIILAFVLARRIRATAGIAVLVPASPALVAIGLGLLSNYGVTSALSRSDYDVATGNGRLQIWQGVWETIDQPSLQLAIGYGANGQITSGASRHYAYLFSGAPLPDIYSTHNLVLQTILDTGYIGLIAIVVVVVVSSLRLERAARLSPSSPAPALLAILAVLFLNGATEALPSYLAPDAMVLALMVMGVGVALTGPIQSPHSGTSPQMSHKQTLYSSDTPGGRRRTLAISQGRYSNGP